MDNFFGFRKSHGNRHYLMTILEKWKNSLEKDEYVCVMSMYL